MPISLCTVDAFTSEAFRGNPAAVCISETPIETDRCQLIAAEMNLSETAFLTPRPDGFGLRWFTPTVEVPICGHATLASAHTLFESGRVAAGETARFHTLSGELRATRADGWISLDFPRFDSDAAELPEALKKALGVTPIACARVRNDAMGMPNWILELDGEAAVRAAAPDFRTPDPWPGYVMITARADDPALDFVSRFFAPPAGIDEDPVTGAAHCALAPYWSGPLGKTAFSATQASARGGQVRVELGSDRVALRGQAVTVMRGELLAGDGLRRKQMVDR